MESIDLSILEMLSLIYEELDVSNVEERFFELVNEIYRFDRSALFFVKHKKGVLQGKLSKGFASESIKKLEIGIDQDCLFTRPLVSGFPLWQKENNNDHYLAELGVENFALVPVVNRKRVSCWKVRNCKALDCPAFGKKWVRCWLVSGTLCSTGYRLTEEEKKKECLQCSIFKDQNVDEVEGVMLVDNSLTGKPIGNDVITSLSIVAHTVGVAINNSKMFMRTLNNAIRDDLTGLHNRRYFNERLIDELERAKRYDETLSLIICDIDHFKRVNDSYGHIVGDMVLIWIANLIREQRRKSDVVARFGGEEFAILLMNTDKNLALEIAENLRCQIEETPFLGDDDKIFLTTSFGVATLGEDANSFDGLVSKADKYMYCAKAQGRNRVFSA